MKEPNSMENSPARDTDFSPEYEAQLARLKPLIYFSLALIVISILSPFVIILLGEESQAMPYFLYALVLPVAFAIYPAWRKGMCPACGRFMAVTVGTHCPKCGVRVRKAETDNLKEN